jgi:hypothetical protein
MFGLRVCSTPLISTHEGDRARQGGCPAVRDSRVLRKGTNEDAYLAGRPAGKSFMMGQFAAWLKQAELRSAGQPRAAVPTWEHQMGTSGN